MRFAPLAAFLASLLLGAGACGLAHAESASEPAGAPVAAAPPPASGSRIVWEVKNRFRLFRRESDFLQHVAAEAGDGVLAAERRLARGSDGRGWARLMVNSLCVDAAGYVLGACERDGTRENYLSPADYPVGVRLSAAPAGATCAWSFEREDVEPQTASVPCGEEVRLRVLPGAATSVTVDITSASGSTERATTEVAVKDFLIGGIGDSIAAGEGNPDRPIALEDGGFCFRRVVSTAGTEYYRPGRAGFRGDKTCDPAASRDPKALQEWARHGAGWMSAACHRSLYSYQLRAALALAVENPHVAVTFVPFACTGAAIESGLFEERRARELTCGGAGRPGNCPQTVPPQLARLTAVLAGARRKDPHRHFDLILLTIGANDIGFSELVANAILEPSAERTLVARAGGVASVEEAQDTLRRKLPARFAKLRAALQPLVGGDLARVVYVSYGNPALYADGTPCPGGRSGVDVHPAFAINGELVRQAATFVEREFLPSIKALATCAKGLCRGEGERMSFVDEHQAGFASHGFCALADTDPAFDRACFSPEGRSFQTNLRQAADKPLLCNKSVRDFRPYASRARWIRTPNDSYFSAMTYPDGLPAAIQPADLHDALWGVLSAVYGGAIHPTAEGHAAMADAALPAMRNVLGLAAAGARPIAATPLPGLPE